MTISILCVTLVFAIMAPASFATTSEDGYVSPEEFFAPEVLPTHEEIMATIYDDPNSVSFNEYDLILIQQEIQYVAMSGSAVMVFRSYNQRSVGMSYGYAHATKNPNVGISLSFSGSGVGAGLSFGLTDKYKVVGKAIDTHYYS